MNTNVDFIDIFELYMNKKMTSSTPTSDYDVRFYDHSDFKVIFVFDYTNLISKNPMFHKIDKNLYFAKYCYYIK